MEFITYTQGGKAVISPAALTLSDLVNEKTLELHAMDNAIVLLKPQMTPTEMVDTISALTRLVSGLSVEMLSPFDAEECDGESDACDSFFEDMLSIPMEAVADAGLLGKPLRIQTVDGAVVISEDTEYDDD